MRTEIAAVLTSVLAGVACAVPLPGEVGTDFTNSLAYAETYDVPIAVVWGNTSCDHCKALAEVIETSEELATWLDEKQILFVHKHEKYGSTDPDYKAAETWIKKLPGGSKLLTFPFVGLYWKDEDGTERASIAFTGCSGTMPVKVPAKDLEGQFIGSLKKYFDDYEPQAVGAFVTTTDSHARLEAESDTPFVEVPIVRKTTKPFEQTIVLSAPGKTSVTNVLSWAAGETEKVFAVEMDVWYAADTAVTLELLDSHGAIVSTTEIGCVGTVPNSPANPYWIGERTANSLAWGEWTMDLAAATQKVAAAEGDAYTLILVGGSKWCPDCVKTDRWLLDQEAFSNWAKDRHVVCVNIDIPKVSGDAEGKTLLADSPSLLTYAPYTVSDRYVKACADGEESRVQSGAAYLSRHGIPQTGNGGTNATAVAERNAWLFLTGTDAGGLCRPDCLDEKNEQTGKFKTGVPCLIVMDKSGRIIGRNFQFNNESPDAFLPCYIDRMDELLEQAEDVSEEGNDCRQTTPDEVPLRGNTGTGDAAHFISYNDVADWYRVPENATGAKMEYRLSGEVDANVRLSAVRVVGSTEQELGAVTGSLKDGLVLGVEKMPSNAFIRVSVPLTTSGVTTGYFALTNEVSTLAQYVLSSDAVLQPTECVQTFEVAAGGAMSVTVEIVEGKKYKLKGEGTIADDRLAYDPEEGLYVASASGNVVVPLEKTTFAYQIWNTGLIVFENDAGSDKEPTSGYVDHQIRVKRMNGSSGVGRVRVEIDRERSTDLPGVFEFEDGQEHVWAEGDSEDWTVAIRVLANEYSDGNQQVVLVLRSVDGSDVREGAVNEYALTIEDNDPASPGKVRIASVTPALAGSVVYAKQGSAVAISLDRTGGSDGAVGCTLSATAGTLDQYVFAWKSRDTSVQQANLSLTGVRVGATAEVKLTPAAGTKADTSAKSFKIQVVAAEAPEFETNAVVYTVHRSVAMTDNAIAVQSELDGQIKVTKASGRIPGGLKATYDAQRNALVFTGAPTASAGQYDAVYRVTAGSVKGLVVAVSFRVIDPVRASTETGVPLNAACAKARTFTDLQVYSDQDWSRLIGLVTVTIPPSGRLSAKYVCASGTVSLVSKNWSAIGSDGSLTAELVGTTKKTSGYSMKVVAFDGGSITCFLQDPSYRDTQVTVLCPGDDWSQLGDTGASDWKGYYTASLAQKNATNESVRAKGDGYMTFKMNTQAAVRRGQVAYAGVLPNGRAFTGSRVLWGYYDTALETVPFAFLPVFNVSSCDDVSGLVLITPKAAEMREEQRRSIYNDKNTYELFNANRFVWGCREGASLGGGYEAEFDVYGGYYDKDEDFQRLCEGEDVFGTNLLTFFVQPQLLDADSCWSTNDTGVSVLCMASGRNEMKLLESDNEQDLTLSFNLSSGLVSGKMDLSFGGETVRANYRGVVLPGWGTAKCSECGDPKECQKRPFVSGTSYFKIGSVTYGCPFSIGLEPGR